MPIPINIWRLGRAVQLTNKKFAIPYENRIRLRMVHSILVRMNELREQGIPYYPARQQAAAEEPNVGAARAAVCRSAIGLYSSYVKKDLKARGYSGSDVPVPKKPLAPNIQFGCERSGQYKFIS